MEGSEDEHYLSLDPCRLGGVSLIEKGTPAHPIPCFKVQILFHKLPLVSAG